jgi:flagellar biosynthesis protein FlhF
VTIKSFFADTVAEAIRDARKELGEEAMLLKSRRAADEARHLGAYEVVFGTTESLPAAVAPATAVTVRATAAPAVSEGIWDIPFEPLPAPVPSAAEPRPSGGNTLFHKLIEMDFDERLAAEFSERVQARLLTDGFSASRDSAPSRAGFGDEAVARAISLETARLLPQNSSLDGGVAALIGPPGGGKTSTIVRLAVAYGLAHGRRVALLAAHDHRVAASGMLSQYAALLNVEFHDAAGVAELQDRVERRREGELILIDTPGYGPRDQEQARELADFLAQSGEIQKHLVLPATVKSEDLRSAVERFEAFGTGHLLFTKLDETAGCGSVFSLAWAVRKPISFFTTGQQVPGDLVSASRFDLAALLRATRSAAMASAA